MHTRKKPVFKSYDLHDCIYMTFWKGRTVGKENSGCQGLRDGRAFDDKKAHKGVLGVSGNIFGLVRVGRDTYLHTH